MGLTIETGVSSITVFLQGLLSFFSPCILPLVPLYLAYLSSGLEHTEPLSRRGHRLSLFLRVLSFTLGIGSAFFLLGLGASAAGTFFSSNRILFARIGGVLIILFGLYQLGILGTSRLLGNEHRLPIRLGKMTMSPLTAFLMGFTFSFAWTPCVGPVLASVLVMAGNAGTSGKGFFLILIYTVGFILPFLAAGIFTSQILKSFQKHRKIVRYTVKAGGALMILMGFLLFTGSSEPFTESLTPTPEAPSIAEKETEAKEESGANAEAESPETSETEENSQERSPAYSFSLEDQYGTRHSLSDYQGKVIFLNFWGTWCPPCRKELPDIQKLYEEYAAQGEESPVVILGAAAPGLGQEGSREEILRFLEENGYTFPVLMDEQWEMFTWYGISSFPTTFMIDPSGNVFGYVPGRMTEDVMRSIIEQALEG